MVEPKTIDNLGIEPSIRWAQDQEFIDSSIIKDSPLVSTQTTIEVSVPCFISAFDLLFQTKQQFVPWALFSPPQGYDLQRMRIFTYQTIPSLGTEELRMAQKQKIKQRIDSKNKRKRKRIRRKGRRGFVAEEEEQEQASKIVIDFLESIDDSDKMMERINALRSQYSKG